MSKALTKQELIDLLNEKYKEIGATDAAEFYGHESDGVWLKGTETQIINGHRVYDDNAFFQQDGVNPELESLFKENGWYGEPYDSGTLMVWKA